jgi:chromosomal replication initiation ATPase DnaA
MEAFVEACRRKFRDDTVEHWFEPLERRDVVDGTARLEVESRFNRQYIQAEHLDILEETAREVWSNVDEIELVLEDETS